MVYDIVTDPNPILHKASALVEIDQIQTREIQKFIKDMIETMYVKNGVGLAAVQVGKPIQIFTLVKQYNSYNLHEDLVLINPTWKKLSSFQQVDEEGCLSVPGLYGEKMRYAKIWVSGYDKSGKKIEFMAEDFFARIIQHEIDHLNGHLFTEKAKNIHRVKDVKPGI